MPEATVAESKKLMPTPEVRPTIVVTVLRRPAPE
jgi:hypothetical protein